MPSGILTKQTTSFFIVTFMDFFTLIKRRGNFFDLAPVLFSCFNSLNCKKVSPPPRGYPVVEFLLWAHGLNNGFGLSRKDPEEFVKSKNPSPMKKTRHWSNPKPWHTLYIPPPIYSGHWSTGGRGGGSGRVAFNFNSGTAFVLGKVNGCAEGCFSLRVS